RHLWPGWCRSTGRLQIPPSPAPVHRRPALASSWLGRHTFPPFSLLLSLTSNLLSAQEPQMSWIRPGGHAPAF
uniref:Uncharacterized protein n=1 Tax=Triticum urartu TaxID=4572 RepID=A0A8R7TYY8_TRIUA